MKISVRKVFSALMCCILALSSICVMPASFAFASDLSCDDKINQAVASWCDSNINSAMTQFEKMKAVYSFVVKNTDYDTPSSKQTNDIDFGERSAHSVYAALFGQSAFVSSSNAQVISDYWNTKKAVKTIPNATKVTVNSYAKTVGNEEYYKISFLSEGSIVSGYTLKSNITVDNTIDYDPYVTFDGFNTISQGYAVCEGYSGLVKALFDYIGIDCQIVTTDYTVDSVLKGHAWNVVKIGDYYYNFDTTFGASKSVKVMNDFNFEYFLRGYSADVMSDAPHKYDAVQASCDSPEKKAIADAISPTDYGNTFDGDVSNAFVYYCKRISDDTVNATNNIVYNGSDYKDYLKVVVPNYAVKKDFNVDFSDVDCVNAGKKSVKITYQDELNNQQTKYVDFYINPHNLASTDIDEENTTKSIQFNGKNVTPSIKFVNSLEAVKDSDYDTSFYRDSSYQNQTTDLKNPGTIYVLVSGKNNCVGNVKLSFNIEKSDLSKTDIVINNGTYQEDYSLNSFTIGDVTLKKGTDYTLGTPSFDNGNKVGSTATMKISAMPSSKYLKNSGNVLLKISNALDLSLLNGSAFGSSSYVYTGNDIKPQPTINAIINSKSVALKYGTDYVVDSYSNNKNVGTAYANVSFKGNFKGNATLKYAILSKDITKLSTSVSSCTYNGKSQLPSITIKDGSKTLEKGTDYIVSGAQTKCGAYKLRITGKNNYNGSFEKIYVIRPKTVTGLKLTSNSTSKINLAWSSLSSTTSSSYPIYYKLYVYDSAKKTWRIILNNTKSTSFSVSAVYYNGKTAKLSAGRVYKFKVIAYIYYGKTAYYGSYSSVLNAETRPAVSSATIYTPYTGRGYITAKWKKASCSGYRVYLSPYSNFSKSVTSKLITKGSTTACKFTGLTKGKYYYVKVRCFKMVNGKRYYGGYSYVKKTKCK